MEASYKELLEEELNLRIETIFLTATLMLRALDLHAIEEVIPSQEELRMSQ